MKKEKEEPEEPSAPFWMLTFSDMVTLLLVFFILILSYSTTELEKFRGAMSSMKGALGIMPQKGSTVAGHKVEFSRHPENDPTEDIKSKIESFQESISEALAQGLIEIDVSGSGVHIRLGDNVLFGSGQARIKATAYPILSQIAKIITRDTKEIYVEGHTDNVPIRTNKYPSNWELSTARAMNVMRYLNKAEGIPMAKMAAVGHGENRPIASNDTAEGRAKNRRVEIFIRWK